MAFTVIECSPTLLGFDFHHYPDTDDSFIYEHLKYYCSKFSSSTILPSPGARVSNGRLLVVSRHKYALIAQELGVPIVRVVLVGDRQADDVTFFRRSDIRVLDFSAIRREEAARIIEDAWHLFFFDAPLTEQQQDQFSHQVVDPFRTDQSVSSSQYSRAVSKIGFPFDHKCAEFLARTPFVDESWIRRHRQECCKFSTEVSQIVSYQGRRFR